MKDCYKTLFEKICEIENLDQDGIKKAENELNNKTTEIGNFRGLLNDNDTCFAYFFVIYAIILKNIDNKLYYEFKSGKNFETIRRIITNDRIKCDICGNESEEEFLNRYQQHYEKLTEKEKEIKGTIDIAVDEFWRILEQ